MSRHAKTKGAMANAYGAGERPRFLSLAPNGHDELWGIGKVMFVLPTVPDDAPPHLEYALRTRRDALLSGICDNCGAVVDFQNLGTIEDVNFGPAIVPHRVTCPASDELTKEALDKFHQDQFRKAVDKTSRETVAKLETRVRNRVHIKGAATEEWALSLLDEKCKSASLCTHLSESPIQTWNMQLGELEWLCDQCWADYLGVVRTEGPQLSIVEDLTCDMCRRYCRSLEPLVLRLSQFVLMGGLCRRCAKRSKSETKAATAEA